MNKVIEFLNTASRHYYNGQPIISDEVFDRLAESVDYANVGAKQHENEEEHYQRMYSLDKFYEDENSKKPLAGYKDVTMSPKIDGAAVSHLYINDLYVRSLTRGDGVAGRVVTDKFMNSKLIPMQLKTGLPVVQVTGELAAPKHVENARNYAAGALNLGSVEEFRTRSVEFFAYGVYPYLSEKFDQDMAILESFGFNTVFGKSIAEVYPTDGIVFRINNNVDFEVAGYTSKHPKGAYAKKERGECVESTILDVVWQVGKSGKVTPVAILEPVLIGDALVSRATLNNQAFIQALDLNIGDTVGIRRAGEIIPQVTHKVSG
jgi:NAD-dependent DNA ligase